MGDIIEKLKERRANVPGNLCGEYLHGWDDALNVAITIVTEELSTINTSQNNTDSV